MDGITLIFGETSWSSEERQPDALLCDLTGHFSRLALTNANIESDVLGQAYEYLIKKFADAMNRMAGEFYMPRKRSRSATATRRHCTYAGRAGHSGALMRFLVEASTGKDQRFGRPCMRSQTVSGHPSDKQQWVDGALVWKKG